MTAMLRRTKNGFARLEREISKFAKDHRSGATDIGLRAARMLAHMPAGDESGVAHRRNLEKICSILLDGHPVMAALWNLSDAVLGISPWPATPQMAAAMVREGARDFIRGLEDDLSSTADTAGELLGRSKKILTHSVSRAVRETLLARAKRSAIEVICTESRPLYEGRTMASALAKAGIKVTFIPDAVVGAVLSEGRAEAVLVGSDSISAAGVANKAGTWLLAMAAHAAGVPFHVVSTHAARLPAGIQDRALQLSHPGKEVWGAAPKNVEVVNRAFDRTPLNLVSLVVLGGRVLSGERAHTELKAFQFSHAVERLARARGFDL
jgi:translation initiation factor 2B subunit (eIF-2B alpha/beta/delta family)